MHKIAIFIICFQGAMQYSIFHHFRDGISNVQLDFAKLYIQNKNIKKARSIKEEAKIT
jgi:hypothetical protein